MIERIRKKDKIMTLGDNRSSVEFWLDTHDQALMLAELFLLENPKDFIFNESLYLYKNFLFKTGKDTLNEYIRKEYIIDRDLIMRDLKKTLKCKDYPVEKYDFETIFKINTCAMTYIHEERSSTYSKRVKLYKFQSYLFQSKICDLKALADKEGLQINYFHPDKDLVLQKANDCYLDKENWFDTERLLA